MNSRQIEIIRDIADAKAPLSLAEISAKRGASKDAVRKTIAKLVDAGHLVRTSPGVFDIRGVAPKDAVPSPFSPESIAKAKVVGPKASKPAPRWQAFIQFDFKYDYEGVGGASINRDGTISNLWAQDHYPIACDGKPAKERKPEWFGSLEDVADVFRSALQRIPCDDRVSLGDADEAWIKGGTDRRGFEIIWDVDKFDNYPIFMWTLRLVCSRKISNAESKRSLARLLGMLEGAEPSQARLAKLLERQNEFIKRNREFHKQRKKEQAS